MPSYLFVYSEVSWCAPNSLRQNITISGNVSSDSRESNFWAFIATDLMSAEAANPEAPDSPKADIRSQGLRRFV